MKRLNILTATIILTAVSALRAEYRLNFFVGDVRVVVNGKAVEPRAGMVVPGDSVVVTGKRSQAHLYDAARGSVVSIQPGEKVSVASLASAKAPTGGHALWRRLRKEGRTAGITASAAVRGEEEGNTDIDWDYGSGGSSKEKGRTSEWKLFSEGKFAQIIPLTKNATDDEGVFLNASSTYFVLGPDAAEKVMGPLEKVIAGGAGSGVKIESCRILAAIHFENARFDRSREYMIMAAKSLPESRIGESGYFILAQSAFYTNRSEEGRGYLRKMKKFHGGSTLLEKIVER